MVANDSNLRCIHCGNSGIHNFKQDEGKLDSKWGMTAFKVIILTYNACGHIELFNKGRTIFDFD